MRSERGMALIAVMMAAAMASALCTALVLVTASNSAVAASFVQSVAVLQAADAALEWAVGLLAAEPDWNALLGGGVRSSFFRPESETAPGPAWQHRRRLDELVNQASCGDSSPCTAAAKRRRTALRPWGDNNPDWRAYAWGPANELVGQPEAADTSIWVVVMVGDDSAETDGDPGWDAGDPHHPGHGVVLLRAEAYGPLGAHATILATVARPADDVDSAPANAAPGQRPATQQAASTLDRRRMGSTSEEPDQDSDPIEREGDQRSLSDRAPRPATKARLAQMPLDDPADEGDDPDRGSRPNRIGEQEQDGWWKRDRVAGSVRVLSWHLLE